MTDPDRAAMMAWLEDAFRVGIWPAQLMERERQFRETYRMLVALVEERHE